MFGEAATNDGSNATQTTDDDATTADADDTRAWTEDRRVFELYLLATDHLQHVVRGAMRANVAEHADEDVDAHNVRLSECEDTRLNAWYGQIKGIKSEYGEQVLEHDAKADDARGDADAFTDFEELDVRPLTDEERAEVAGAYADGLEDRTYFVPAGTEEWFTNADDALRTCVDEDASADEDAGPELDPDHSREDVNASAPSSDADTDLTKKDAVLKTLEDADEGFRARVAESADGYRSDLTKATEEHTGVSVSANYAGKVANEMWDADVDTDAHTKDADEDGDEVQELAETLADMSEEERAGVQKIADAL